MQKLLGSARGGGEIRELVTGESFSNVFSAASAIVTSALHIRT